MRFLDRDGNEVKPTVYPREPPCDVTSKPCVWVSDFDVHDDGSTSGTTDLFCCNCLREYEPTAHAAPDGQDP